MSSVTVAGVRVDDVERAEIVDRLFGLRARPGTHLVTYCNPHACNMAAANEAFAAVLAGSDLTTCDGTGVRKASRWLGTPLKGRFTFPQVADAFFDACRRREAGVFLVGEPPDVLRDMMAAVERRHPGLRIVGGHQGFFEQGGREESDLIQTLKAGRPDFILLGMGMPRQELFGERLRAELPRGVIVCVGALFRYYSGHAYRGPAFMTENGLEWLWRLGRHPVKYFRRYVIGNVRFLWKVLRQKCNQNRI